MAETTMVGGGDTAGGTGSPAGWRGWLHTGECWRRALRAGRKNQAGPCSSGFGALRAELRPRETSFLLSSVCASASGKQNRRYINSYLLVLSVVGETKNRSVQLPLSVGKRSKIGTNNSGTHRWEGSCRGESGILLRVRDTARDVMD